jgi:antitoxin ParD1/3/4
MSSYQFTPQAVEDLFELWSYIAGDDLEAADRVEEGIHVACAFLAGTPLAGRIREDLTALPMRFWLVQPYRNYWIVYDPGTRPLQVIRIIHAARDIPPLLRKGNKESVQRRRGKARILIRRKAAASGFADRDALDVDYVDYH